MIFRFLHYFDYPSDLPTRSGGGGPACLVRETWLLIPIFLHPIPFSFNQSCKNPQPHIFSIDRIPYSRLALDPDPDLLQPLRSPSHQQTLSDHDITLNHRVPSTTVCQMILHYLGWREMECRKGSKSWIVRGSKKQQIRKGFGFGNRK